MRAAIYCRISKDAEARGLGVRRQEKDCRRLIADRRWTVAGVYVDNDITAARKDGTLADRPDYRRLLADCQSGAVDAVVAYDLDRLHRDPLEAEEFYVLAERAGLRALATPGDHVDLQGGDLLVARIKAAVAAEEVRKIRRRIRSKHQELAESGRPSGGGKRPFGYRPGGMEVDPEEAEVIRQAAARILAGESLITVAADTRLLPATLSRVLRSPRVVGVREHKGERHPAARPAILDADTQARVMRRLTAANKGAGRGRRGAALLSGLLRCGRGGCGRVLRSQGAGLYACKRGDDGGGCGRCAIRAAAVEDIVVETFLGFLSDPEMAQRRSTAAGTGFDADAILGRLEEDRELLKDFAGMLARREIGKDEWAAMRAEVERRIAGAEAELHAAAMTDGRENPAAVLKQWETATPERRRSWLAAYLEAVEVAPVGRGSRVPAEDRLTFRWRA